MSLPMDQAVTKDNEGSEGEDVQLSDKLRQRILHLQSMCDQLPVLFWTTDFNFRLTSITGGALFLPKARVVRLLYRSLNDDSPQLAPLAHARALSGETVSYDLEFEGRILQCHVGPYRDVNGKIIGCIGGALDITEREEVRTALVHSEKLYQVVSELVSDAILLMDEAGQIVYANSGVQAVFGFTPEELAGQNLGALMPPHARAPFASALERFVKTGTRSMEWEGTELSARRKDGSPLSVRLRISEYHKSGRRYFVGTVQDCTRQKETQTALRRSEERFDLLVRTTNDGLWDWDLGTNEIYFSGHWRRLAGCPEPDTGAGPSGWLARIHPADRPLFGDELSRLVRGLSKELNCRIRMLQPDGSYRTLWVHGLALRGMNGSVERIAGTMSDLLPPAVSAHTEPSSCRDTLTGLANRSLFIQQVSEGLRECRVRENRFRFAVLFVDLDGFKIINDSMGHLFGDHYLCEAARRVEACLRPGDLAARLGGDEFAILLYDICSAEAALEFGQHLLRVLADPIDLHGSRTFFSASIGVAMGDESAQGAEELLRDADTAMYYAKRAGKNCCRLFTSRMHAEMVARFFMENELRLAHERHEFQLLYQPIVNLTSGRMEGLEALLRWNHPHRGLLAPREFMAVAEEVGLMPVIEKWTIEEVCRQARAWLERFPDAKPLAISVNLSSRLLLRPDFYEYVDDTIRKERLDHSSLRFDLTERMMLGQDGRAEHALLRLRERGLQMHIDDFGTGLSSLSALHRFPFDVVKIDHSFVSQLYRGGDDAEIVRSILALSRILKRSVIAEGVETRAQAELLAELGCQHAQGNYFTPPKMPQAIEDLITADKGWERFAASIN